MSDKSVSFPGDGLTVGSEIRLTGGEFTGLENVGREVGCLLPAKAPGRAEGHRVLDLVDEIRQRLSTPVREESLPRQRGSLAGALERIAMTHRALGLVNQLRPLCLRGGVNTV